MVVFLLLWPSLWALWIAGEGQPRWGVVVIFILGVALMRSAGCAINDYADRNFDGKVKRTSNRSIVMGRVRAQRGTGSFCRLESDRIWSGVVAQCRNRY